VISGPEAFADGQREDLLEEGGREGDQPVVPPFALDDAELALLDEIAEPEPTGLGSAQPGLGEQPDERASRLSSGYDCDELVRGGMELVAVGPDAPKALGKLGVLPPGGLRLGAFPRRKAQEAAGLVQVSHQTKGSRPRELRGPADELLPRPHEVVLFARLHDPHPARVGLSHPESLRPPGRRFQAPIG
jgi:hypothetical protein